MSLRVTLVSRLTLIPFHFNNDTNTRGLGLALLNPYEKFMSIRIFMNWYNAVVSPQESYEI
jgi:hypothetical protein